MKWQVTFFATKFSWLSFVIKNDWQVIKFEWKNKEKLRRCQFYIGSEEI